MLVVSDTSPLRALSAIDQLGLIPAIYGQVVVPPAVLAELSVSVANLPRVVLSDHAFLAVRSPANVQQVDELRKSLGPGEAEAIALALEIHAEAVLMDERRGRAAAIRFGLHPVGVLAILVEAKSRRLLPAVKPLIEALDERIAFRVRPDLLQSVLRSAGEA